MKIVKNHLSKRFSRRDFCLMVTAAAGLTAAPLAQAQPAPMPATVTLVVPYAAGGVTDTLARALARRLSETWGNAVVVDNRTGGGTVIGTAAVARAAGDGATLLVTSFGFVGNQLMLPSLPYAPSSLAPVSLIGESTGVLLVHPSVPARNVVEFAAWMRSRAASGANPVTFASSGNGSSVHVMAEMFGAAVGVPITHVPYRGNAPGLTDLMGGQVQAMFDSTGALSHVKAGRLRALAVSTAQRSVLAADLPTLAESACRRWPASTPAAGSGCSCRPRLRPPCRPGCTPTSTPHWPARACRKTS